ERLTEWDQVGFVAAGTMRCLRWVWRGVVAQQARWFVNNMGCQITNVVQMPEFAFQHGLCFQGPNRTGISFSFFREANQFVAVNGCNSANGGLSHCFIS